MPTHSSSQVLNLVILSDFHFFHFHLDFKGFLSKCLLANLNHLFRRKSGEQQSKPLETLIDYLNSKEVTKALLCGDMTTSSLIEEYSMARAFVTKLQDLGLKIYPIPGNHDVYTKQAEKQKRFYHFFEPPFLSPHEAKPKFSLEKDRISIRELNNTWTWIGLDTCVATPLFSSRGYFSPALEKKLTQTLNDLPQDKPIILMNHFPLINEGRPKRHTMKRAETLQKLLKSSSKCFNLSKWTYPPPSNS